MPYDVHEVRLFTDLHDPDGKWQRIDGMWVQQEADAVGTIDLDLPYFWRIKSVHMAVSHPGRTGGAPPVHADRGGWSIYRRDLRDPESETWEAPELLETVAPTINTLTRDDQSPSLGVYQSQHYIERAYSTATEKLDPRRYHYFAAIRGENSDAFNPGELLRFHGLFVVLMSLALQPAPTFP